MMGFDVQVGVDTESVHRWRKELEGLAAGPRRGLFTEREHAYCASFADPAPHYAARWCAKEAVLKALSSRCVLDPREIEIERDAQGAPVVRIPPDRVPGPQPTIRLSVSHSQETAVAFAVAIFP